MRVKYALKEYVVCARIQVQLMELAVPRLRVSLMLGSAKRALTVS
jgi:hypothetical protein